MPAQYAATTVSPTNAAIYLSEVLFGLDEITKLAINPEHVALEQKLMSYYAFFFANGTPEVLAKAQQLVREKVKKKKSEDYW